MVWMGGINVDIVKKVVVPRNRCGGISGWYGRIRGCDEGLADLRVAAE